MKMPWEKAGMKNKCDGCEYVVDASKLGLSCKMDYGQCFEGHRWGPNKEVAERLQQSAKFNNEDGG